MKQRKLFWVLSFSLANLVLLSEWVMFLYPGSLHLKGAPNFLEATFAMGAASLIGTLAIYLYLRLCERFLSSHSKIYNLSWVPLYVMLLFPLNTIRTLNNLAISYPWLGLENWVSWLGYRKLVFISIGLVFALVIGQWKKGRYLTAAFKFILMATAPFAVIAWLQLGLAGVMALRSEKTVAESTPGKPKSLRLIVMLFDELAEHAVDPKTAPPELRGKLPNVDALRSASWFAGDAHSPAPLTSFSVPAYLTGKIPEKYRPQPMVEDPGKGVDVGEIKRAVSIFDRLNEQGHASSAYGWFIPYCRAFGSTLLSCASFGGTSYDFGTMLLPNLHRMLHRLFYLRGSNNADDFKGILFRVLQGIEDPRADLIYTHWPVPHLPRSYDSLSGELVVSHLTSEFAYMENVFLVDRAIGEIRKAVEASSRKDDTVLLVLADHAVHRYRPWVAGTEWEKDRRVPFWIHFPGQTQAVVYPDRLQTGYFYKLIPELITTPLNSPDTLTKWFKNHPEILSPNT